MSKTAFDNVIGYEDIKLELRRILDQLVSPEKYEALCVPQSHGLLICGTPGVGKSTIAKSFLEASGRRGYICRKDKPNGDFVKEISRVFDEAAQNAPSVILLDDMDKFTNEDGDAEEFVTVQSCIDRVKDRQVFVVATVNDRSKLPDSLVRSGRFDHILEVGCPEGKDAEAIVAYYLSQKPYVANLDVRRITRLLTGKSCADLESVVNLAGSYAAFAGKDRIEMEDMIKAILREAFEAPEKVNSSIARRRLVACHEAGHALVAEMLEPGSVDLVSVLAHESGIASITALYRDEDYFFSKNLMEVRVMCLLAGKAATELCFGTVDTGANSDLRRAFDIVHRFVDHYCSNGFDKFVFDRTSSNDLLNRRDSAVALEMERYYERAKKLLVENREKLMKLADTLFEKQTILGEELQEILK